MVSTSSYVEQGSKQKGTIHVVRDTTDRRIAEEKYRLLFEQVQEGVFVATPEGKLLDCNDAFMRMLGHSNREELLALNVDAELYASHEQREVFRREVELHNYVATLKSRCAARTAPCSPPWRAVSPPATPTARSSATRASCST